MGAARAPGQLPLAALIRQAAPGAMPFEAAVGALLQTAGDPLKAVLVIEEGLVAMLATAPDGGRSETALLGPDGLVGQKALLGATTARLSALALTDVRGISLKAGDLSRAAEALPFLTAALAARLLNRIEETERICACAAVHSIERRLADWLRRASLITGGGAVTVIHDRLASVLGVRRASVTVALHMLEGEHAIRCTRGRIEIRDAKRLGELACGCRG